jgi:hypothetical protein
LRYRIVDHLGLALVDMDQASARTSRSETTSRGKGITPVEPMHLTAATIPAPVCNRTSGTFHASGQIAARFGECAQTTVAGAFTVSWNPLTKSKPGEDRQRYLEQHRTVAVAFPVTIGWFGA